jgi:hypothetical protein
MQLMIKRNAELQLEALQAIRFDFNQVAPMAPTAPPTVNTLPQTPHGVSSSAAADDSDLLVRIQFRQLFSIPWLAVWSHYVQQALQDSLQDAELIQRQHELEVATIEAAIAASLAYEVRAFL